MAKVLQSINLDDLPEVIFGAEDPPADNGVDTQNQSGAAGSSNNGAAGGTSTDDPDDTDDASTGNDDTAGLKSALAKERKAARDEKKRADALQREKDARELAEKTAIEQAEIKAQEAAARAARLAEGLLNRDLEAAITRAAQALNFIDVTDALAGVDRTSLVYEQDEDDPTQITIDLKTVEREVKRLATAKPHFVKAGTDDRDATGSNFGNGGRKPTKTPLEVYQEKYPSLR